MIPALPAILRRPSRGVALLVSTGLVVLWAGIRLAWFGGFVLPLTYTLPLLVCIWSGDKVALWAMAGAFAALHTLHQWWMMPPGGLVAGTDWPVYLATLANIGVGALAVHLVVSLRARLERALRQVSAASEELSAQAEELAQQAEELSQQNEELAGQGEELQAQNEEIQALADELSARERLVRGLLETARHTASDASAIAQVCATGRELLGSAAAVVAVHERDGRMLSIRECAGVDRASLPASLPLEGCFVALALEHDRVAALADTALRPDLGVLEITGRAPFRAVLAAPLRHDGAVFGALSVYSYETRDWTEEQFRVVEWLAADCAQILGLLRAQRRVQRQAALLALSPDAILVRELDGTVSYWAPGAQALYGWSQAEAEGRVGHELLKARFPQPLADIDAEFREKGCWAGEITHVTRDGREVVVQSRWLAERDAHGAIAAVLESNVDVTERVQAEGALRQQDRRKSEFLAVLSHELRNPLAPMRYALELLPRGTDAVDAPWRVIERQLAHLVRLVDDLLDLTRIETDKITLRRRSVGCEELVRAAVEAVKPELAAAAHRLEIELPAEPVVLEGDTDRLTQVLVNLLNNAARYTPGGGTIRVGVASEDGHALLRVSDTGVGLRPEQVERVFDMFTQFGDSAAGGLGIGLALVRRLVELHGGSVEARSDGPGRGSEFLVRLPAVARSTTPATHAAAAAEPDAAGQDAAEPRAAAAPQRAARRVLVVDDNVDAAEMMKAILEMDGHEVCLAHDATSALATLGAFEPEIALLDIGLPGMDGYDLARGLRAHPRASRAFLVAVTGWGQDDDRQRARDAGFDAHLTKPANPADVERLVAAAPWATLAGA